QGRLVQYASPRELYERPANRFVAEFIGESNFLPVEVAGGEARYAGQRLALAEPPQGAGAQELLLRPEKLGLLQPGDGVAGGNRFQGRLTQAIFQGESVLLNVQLDGGGEVQARLPNRRLAISGLPEIGESVTLGLAAEDALLLGGSP